MRQNIGNLIEHEKLQKIIECSEIQNCIHYYVK